MISSPNHSNFHLFACCSKKTKHKHQDKGLQNTAVLPQGNQKTDSFEIGSNLTRPHNQPKGNVQTESFDKKPKLSVKASAGIAAIIEQAKNEEDLAPIFSELKNHPEFATILLKSHNGQPESISWSIQEEMALFISRQLENGNDALLHRILDDLSLQNIASEELQPFLDTMARGVVRSTSSPQARWEWSQAFDKVVPKAPVHKIENFSKNMMKEKQTSRHLNAYQERLKIPSKVLGNLHKGRLCLVGGGYSRIKQDLLEQGVKCNVTNIDPICTQHDPENEDTKPPQNFCEPGILDKLKKHGYAEVWALHSLPQYAMSPAETLLFYQNALSLLKSKGVLRVTPATGFSEGFTAGMRLSRPIVSETSDKIIKALESRPDLFRLDHHQPKTKSTFGKLKMHGVNIKMIGSTKQVDAFLQNDLPSMI